MYLRLFIAIASVLAAAILVGVFAVSLLLAVLVLLPVAVVAIWLARRLGGPPPHRADMTIIEGDYRVEEPGKLPPERKD